MTAPESDLATDLSIEPASPPDSPSERTRPRRFLPRFGLRSLFVFALLFCLVFGWIGRNAYRMRQEDAAIETLKAAGASIVMQDEAEYEDLDGFFVYGGQSPPLPPSSFARMIGWSNRLPIRAVRLHELRIDESRHAAALDALGKLTEIERVILLGKRFDDGAIPALSKLSRLEELILSRTEITGDGLASLAPHVRLRRIDVDADRTNVLSGLSGFADLNEAKLVGMDVTREDVADLAALPHLERLEFWSMRPTHAGPGGKVRQKGEEIYTPLAQAKSLKTFYVWESGLTDQEVAALAELPRLESLLLEGIGDAGLARLGDQPNLNMLRVGPPVTRQAAREFSAAHPACLVYYWVDSSDPFDNDRFADVGVPPDAERREYFRAGESTEERSSR